jgi:hypothetical protein
MKIEYIRDVKEIEKVISDLESKNVNVKTGLAGSSNKLAKLYLYAPLEKLYSPNELGLEGDFGGRVHKIAKIKETDVYLLCDSMNNGIGMFRYAEEEVKIEKTNKVQKVTVEEEENFGERMKRIRAEKKSK